jgi:hypothetical protein
MLTVEDGTGLTNADSYVSLADFKAYCDGRGYGYTGSADDVLEQKLRLASDYVDTIFRYKGMRLVNGQAREFPRTSLIDDSGYEVTGVPGRVLRATSELAFKGLTEDLYVDLDRGGRIASESVGPISVSYAADAPAGKTFRFAENLLRPYIRGDMDLMNPVFFGTSETPSFTKGMDDQPGDYNPLDATT